PVRARRVAALGRSALLTALGRSTVLTVFRIRGAHREEPTPPGGTETIAPTSHEKPEPRSSNAPRPSGSACGSGSPPGEMPGTERHRAPVPGSARHRGPGTEPRRAGPRCRDAGAARTAGPSALVRQFA